MEICLKNFGSEKTEPDFYYKFLKNKNELNA